MLNRFFVVACCLVAVPALSSAGDKKPAIKGEWKPLFDGKTLDGWKVANFGGEGEVLVEKGYMLLDRGTNMTGVSYAKKDFPKIDYEVLLEAKKLNGSDFFCTTTFPVGDSFCSFVVGGWGGAVVGLSSIDGKDASENETKKLMGFKYEQWYKVRIRVTKERIQAWIDDEKMVDFKTAGKKITIRPECDLCRPFGIATYATVGAVRDVRVRAVDVWQDAELEKLRGRWTTLREKPSKTGAPAQQRIDLVFTDGKLTVLGVDEKGTKKWSDAIKVTGVEQVKGVGVAYLSRLNLQGSPTQKVQAYYDFVGGRLILVGSIGFRPWEGFQLSGEYRRVEGGK
ncbi:MAG: DUF1080 domain-containing protein [Gemmataceae bacterium]